MHATISYSFTNLVCSLPILQQRMEHKKREDGKTSALTDERLERLQSIEFIWGKRKGQVGWDNKYVSHSRTAELSWRGKVNLRNDPLWYGDWCLSAFVSFLILPFHTHRMNSFNIRPSLATVMSLRSSKRILLLADGSHNNVPSTKSIAKERSLRWPLRGSVD